MSNKEEIGFTDFLAELAELQKQDELEKQRKSVMPGLFKGIQKAYHKATGTTTKPPKSPKQLGDITSTNAGSPQTISTPNSTVGAVGVEEEEDLSSVSVSSSTHTTPRISGCDGAITTVQNEVTHNSVDIEIQVVEDIPDNSEVKGNLAYLLDKFMNADAKASPPVCSECEQPNATLYCENCHGNVCEGCYKVTHASKLLRQHVITKIDDPEITVAHMCQFHPKEKLSIYCVACQDLVCRDCLLSSGHKDHKYIAVKDTADAHSKTLGDVLNQKLVKFVDLMALGDAKISNEIDTLNANLRKCQTEMDTQFGKILKFIENRRTQLGQELQQAYNLQLSKLEHQREDMKDKIALTQKRITLGSKVLQKGSEPQIIALNSDLIIQSQKLSFFCAHNLIGFPSGYLNVTKFWAQMPSIEKMVSEFGGVAADPESKKDFGFGKQFFGLKEHDFARFVNRKIISSNTREVTSVAVAGHYLFSASLNKSITVWDLSKDFANVCSLLSHTNVVNVLTTYKDEFLISGSLDHNIKIWSLDTFSEVATLNGHTKGVLCMHVNGKYLFSGGASGDNTIKVWDMETFHKVATLDGHKDGVYSLASSNKFLFSGSADKTIRVWDINTFRHVETITRNGNTIYSMAVYENKYLISGELNALKIRSAETFSDIKTLTVNDWPSCLTVGGNYLFAGLGDCVRVWDLRDFNSVQKLVGHTKTVSGIALYHNFIISSSYDETIKVWGEKPRHARVSDSQPMMLKDREVSLPTSTGSM